MYIHRLKISGLRGVKSANVILGKHSVLVGSNNNGKTTIVEALALLLGRAYSRVEQPHLRPMVV